MSKEKEFDVESISGYQYMEEKDKEYFEKFGSSMDAQLERITEQNKIDPKTMSAQYDYLLDTLVSNLNEYIVNGAPLGCSNWTDELQEFTYQNGTIKSIPVSICKTSMLQLPEDRKEMANGFVFANVLDTQGGLRDELLMEHSEEGNAINIQSFGNCQWIEEENITKVEDIADKLYEAMQKRYAERPNEKAINNRMSISISKDEVLERVKEAIEQGKGTCFCCMHLNPEWENMPPEYDFATNSFQFKLPSAGINAFLNNESYMPFYGAEGINMMSMVFCRRGGIIKAKESGQSVSSEEYVTRSMLESVGFLNVTDECIQDLNRVLGMYGIISLEEIRHFLSQCVVESWYGKALTEINWDDFPNNNQVDDEIHFNEIYAKKSGNCEAEDGYKFRGGGYMHLTGRANYQAFSDYLESEGRPDPNIMQKGADAIASDYAWESAAWFWKYDRVTGHNGTEWVEIDGSVEKLTYFVNRGENNLKERQIAYDNFQED